ncbi:hypothetical protein FDO65_10030 [Nakamurella flava]|uniref:Uncharacterized protein n=1 Tax=Nakamurella flava TaxID=2576308 RepID=A0A4V6CSJ7_9ACTN|nr:hypothetical protein [Nakamurella flava]TKV61855.1 hypothetical protein FDO65_10030 [Nakamurella flava]
MAGTELKLDGEALTALVTKSIVDNITDEQREQFIAVAIGRLMQVEKDWTGRPKQDTPLQAALYDAMQAACRVLAVEMVEQNPALQQQLRDRINEAIASTLTDENSRLNRLVGEAISTALTSASYD